MTFFIASSAIGSLNILDIPWCVSYVRFAYKLAGETPPKEWENFVNGKAPKFSLICQNPLTVSEFVIAAQTPQNTP